MEDKELTPFVNQEETPEEKPQRKPLRKKPQRKPLKSRINPARICSGGVFL